LICGAMFYNKHLSGDETALKIQIREMGHLQALLENHQIQSHLPKSLRYRS
jgi:hypothetical protein